MWHAEFYERETRFQTSSPRSHIFPTNNYVQKFPYDRKKYINAYPPPSNISIVVNEKIIYQNFTAIYDQEGWLFMLFYQEMLQMKQ